MQIQNQTILILGEGESGRAASALAYKSGAKNIIFDLSEDILDNIGLAVISPGISVYSDIALKVKAKGIPLISELEFGFRNCAADIIAVTGTNGKSTTVSLIGAAVVTAGRRAEVLGNIGTAFCRKAAELTAGETAVLEVSSFQLEAAAEFRPHIGVLLNATPDHIDRHRTFDNYIDTKFRLFQNQRGGDIAVLNADDPEIVRRAGKVKSEIYWFSTEKKVRGCYFAGGELLFWDGADEPQSICKKDGIRLIGEHNMSNAAAAALACLLYGIPAEAVRKTLKEFTGIRHRLEFIRELDGVKYFNDSKGTNIESTLKAAASVEGPTVLILGGSDKGGEFDELFRRLPKSVKNVITIGETAGKLGRAAERCGFENIMHAGALQTAVLMAKAVSARGGNILLSPACASFDMFINFEHRGNVFSEIVNHLISFESLGEGGECRA